MSDGKLTYDIDFNVHSEAISDAISRAVARATSGISYTKPSTTSIDAALYDLGNRLSAGKSFYGRVARNLGFGDVGAKQLEFFQSQGVNSLADFAALATSQKYGYTPSTTQTIINSAVASALHKSKKKPDMQWKFEMESLTNDIRAAQREQSKASLAYEYSQQGLMFANAAAQAATPEAQKMLLGRAASRYASIASRTLVESGAVSPDDAAIALSTAADLGAIRSGIKTTSQLAAARDKDYERMEAIKAREETFASKKAAQEDAAWAAREKELLYSGSQKALEMEKGFRAIEAASATEAAYNPNADPAVARDAISSSIAAANRYAIMAGQYGAGSVERQAYVQMARGALSGVTMSSMAKAGLSTEAIKENTMAILNITKILEGLGNSGNGGGEGGSNGHLYYMIGQRIGNIISTGAAIAGDVMEGRTKWLADTKTAYQTRRDVRQEWAKKYGMAGIKVGATGGAIVGGTIGGVGGPVTGLIGAGIGGAVGAVPGVISYIAGTHNKDEKTIADAYQTHMVDMHKYRSLYGNGVEYNYAQLIENMGMVSASSVLGLNQAADMLPGAMMFGAVSENQMLGLSYMPNYWRALMNGASTSELYEAYAGDLLSLPKPIRQYISSLLPGINEDLRAFAQSGESFDVASTLAGRMRQYDADQYALAPGYIRAKNYIATQNARYVNEDIVNDTRTAHAPNYFSSEAEWRAAMADTADDGLYRTSSNSVAEAWNETRRRLGLREYENNNTNGKLGDIIIQIDGNTIHQEEYSTEAFIRGQQTLVVGV